MQNFSLQHKKFQFPIQIAKFPYSLPFPTLKEAIIRKKGPEDEEKEEEDKQEIKKATKQSGHIGTNDKKYFGDKKTEMKQREEWILDTKVPQKPLFEGLPTDTDKNTSYYVFIYKDNSFYAIPVEPNWLHFKPFIKSNISLEKAEEIMKLREEALKKRTN